MIAFATLYQPARHTEQVLEKIREILAPLADENGEIHGDAAALEAAASEILRLVVLGPWPMKQVSWNVIWLIASYARFLIHDELEALGKCREKILQTLYHIMPITIPLPSQYDYIFAENIEVIRQAVEQVERLGKT